MLFISVLLLRAYFKNISLFLHAFSHRTLVSSEKSLDGKLFVEFVALIYLSYLKKQMQVKNLGRYYTMTGLLDKLDVIECF